MIFHRLGNDVEQIILGVENKFHCMFAQSEPTRELVFLQFFHQVNP